MLANWSNHSLAPWDAYERWVLYESAIYLNGNGMHVGGWHENIINDRALFDNPTLTSLRVPENKLMALADIKYPLNFLFVECVHSISIIQNLIKKLKPNGHLILLNCNIDSSDIIKTARGRWIEKFHTTKHFNQDTKDTLRILKLCAGGKGISKATDNTPFKGGGPAKRACVVRFGAIGDIIMLTPLIKRLYDDNYKVTVLTQGYNATVLKHNPYVDNLIQQGRNVIPNPELGKYMEYWQESYDQFVNLSESVEGKYLKVENRKAYFDPKDLRQSSDNYYDATLAVAGYKPNGPTKAMLHLTPKEYQQAEELIDRKNFNIMWALKGSSYHKLYPIVKPLLKEWLADKPDVQVLLTGGEDALPYAFNDLPQVTSLVNTIPLRTAMALTAKVDLVIGPETGMLNAAGCFDTPKIIFMSHSKPVNLTKYWDNTVALEPEVPCYPCFQLHYSLESCPLRKLSDSAGNIIYEGPACTVHERHAGAISAARVMAELDKVYSKWQATRN